MRPPPAMRRLKPPFPSKGPPLSQQVSGSIDAAESILVEIAQERLRQIEGEGWTPEHDDEHGDGELALAAACYALPVHRRTKTVVADEVFNGRAQAGDVETYPIGQSNVPEPWPWLGKWWKPGDRRGDLLKAGALIVAEIERLDRAAGA